MKKVYLLLVIMFITAFSVLVSKPNKSDIQIIEINGKMNIICDPVTQLTFEEVENGYFIYITSGNNVEKIFVSNGVCGVNGL